MHWQEFSDLLFSKTNKEYFVIKTMSVITNRVQVGLSRTSVWLCQDKYNSIISQCTLFNFEEYYQGGLDKYFSTVRIVLTIGHDDYCMLRSYWDI